MPEAEEFGMQSEEEGVSPMAPRPKTVGPPLSFDDLRARQYRLRQAQATGQPVPASPRQVQSYPVYSPAQPAQQAAQAPEYDDDRDPMEVVEEKLQLASYYRSLREQPVFGDMVHSDVFAAQVQTELDDWVTSRMKELVGIQTSVAEGLSRDEQRLVATLVRGLGPDGVRAIVALAAKVLSPTPSPVSPAPQLRPPSATPSVAPVVAPAAPSTPTPPVGPARPRVRRVTVPGPSNGAQQREAPIVEAAPARPRARKKDPLAAGRASVARSQAPEPVQQPVAQVQPQQFDAPDIRPVPMPHGLAMTAATAAQASAALSNPNVVIEATGAGVFNDPPRR